MQKWFFVPHLLELLARGAFFRRLFFFLFRAGAVLTAVVGVGLCAGVLTLALRLPAAGVIGGFLFIAFLAVAFYAAAHIYWLRAEDVRLLPDAEFTMIPIVSVMLRTGGEVLAVLFAVVSVGACILLWFAGDQAGAVLEGIPASPLAMLLGRGGNPFLEGLFVLAGGVIYALVLLAAFYFAAEAVLVLAQIARNTGLTALHTGGEGVAAFAPRTRINPAAPPATPPRDSKTARAAATTNCSTCGTFNSAGAAFCENCGNPLALITA